MSTSKLKILGISGSLRPASSTGAVLKIVADQFPEDVDFKIYNDLEKIPAFDDSRLLPLPVTDFIQQIKTADAVLLCIPEYAFGVPGALKNALDWTVSSTAFSEKPVALITAASNGEKAHAAMALTLSALGSRISEETKLLVPFIKTKLDEGGRVTDPGLLQSIQRVIDELLLTIDAEIRVNHS